MRALPISWAASRFDKQMLYKTASWASICATLSKPKVCSETYAEYIALDKEAQTNLKDCGYYIIGRFVNNLRHNAEFAARATVTLDIDKPGVDFESRLAAVFGDYEFFWHTSRKSNPVTPRIRVHLPLARDLTSGDEYEALARMLASWFDINLVDRVSYVPAQMMFFPSRSRDGVFEFGNNTGKWLDPDEVLARAYMDPLDRAEWPRTEDEPPPETRKTKVDSPLTKPGVIGAFCRAYSITRCLEELIAGVYEPSTTEGRWRYHAAEGGSGAIVYDNDTALYSHHTGHDPISGRSVNAFDLVRVHKFGAGAPVNRDADVDVDLDGITPTGMPSFKAMQAYAMTLPEVVAELMYVQAFDDIEEGRATAQPAARLDPVASPPQALASTKGVLSDAENSLDDLPSPAAEAIAVRARLREMIADCVEPDGLVDAVLPAVVGAELSDAVLAMVLEEIADRHKALTGRKLSVLALRKSAKALRAQMTGVTEVGGQHVELEYDQQGVPVNTVTNMEAFVSAGLMGWRIAFDVFYGDVVRAPLDRDEWQPFKDADYVHIRKAMERAGFTVFGGGNELIKQCITVLCDQHQIDTAQVWLHGLMWDGVPRIEQFFVRYLGVPDSPYSRGVGRYWWSGLAGRIMRPGVKADMMPILVGRQGQRKSSAVEAMAAAPDHFTLFKFDAHDADAGRKLAGKTIAEVGELRGMNNADEEGIKTFMASPKDTWVPKYKERAVTFLRRCMFIGTTDKPEFLSDVAGNRRWLPMTVGRIDTDAIRDDLAQLYAEGAELFTASGVDFGVERLAKEAHAEHTISDLWDERIEEWLAAAIMDGEDLDDSRTNGQTEFTIARVLEGIGVEITRNDKGAERRVALVLTRAGYERGMRRERGKVRRFWHQKPLL